MKLKSKDASNIYVKCRVCGIPEGPTVKLKDWLCNDCLHQAYLHWREVAYSAVLDHRELCLLIRREGLKMRDLVRVVTRYGTLPPIKDRGDYWKKRKRKGMLDTKQSDA